MKILISVLIFLFISTMAFCETLYKGSFVPLHPTKTLSSATVEENDDFYFIVPSDMWLEEYKIIPKNSIIKAKVTMLKMPVTGINAAIRLQANEIIFPNGERYEIQGNLSYRGEIQIGGTLTPPLSYNKSMHKMKGQWFDGAVAQYVPSGEYEFGQHVTIRTSETLYLILTQDFTPY